MDNQNQPYKVVIYNQTYNLRSDHRPDYIQDLAEYVDRRMNQIADELFQARKDMNATEEEIAERSAKYAELLDQFLRPDAIEPPK
jgi:cell division protein ZapA (FtsZ GTPase activity inhibitor)